MAPKGLMKTTNCPDDSCCHDADGVDRTVSLYLSNSSMSMEEDNGDDDDDDDEEMERTKTRQEKQQHKEKNGISNKEEDQHCGLQCTKQNDEPKEHKRPGENDETAENKEDDTTIMEIIYKAWTESHWAFQVVATITACFWTYALIHDGNGNGDDDDGDDDVLNWDAQIAIMVVLVLAGVSCPIDLFAPVGVGVFAGAVPISVVPTYATLTVLAVVSAVVWRIVAYTRFLAGFGGRMGTTTFIAMNITAVFFLIPFGLMQDGWNAYGQPDWNSSSDVDSDDDDVLFEWDKAIVFVCSTIFLSVAGAAFRIRAPRGGQAAAAVHPFLTPCAVALACDLFVAATVSHRLASTAYVGFSIGSYVAMAALTNLPHNEADFLFAGLFAGLMGVCIEPFFVDFAGKAGFTAFLGYSTYKFIIMPLVQFLLRCKPKREIQQRHEES